MKIYQKNRIYILTGAIHTGKTSALGDWLDHVKSKGGFITPDIDGKRKLQSLNTGAVYNFEVEESFDKKISIGRFHFSKLILREAAEEVLYILEKGVQFLVIDEIGRLEIESNEGFYPILQTVIDEYQKPGFGYLILVIRDSLLQKGIDKFNLHSATVMSLDDFKSRTQNFGLVLAGGDSKRMGNPKGLIQYHSESQQSFLYKSLAEFCKKAFLSVRENNQLTNPDNFPCIEDDLNLPQMGPMTALLSAINTNPFANWYILACDYAYLKKRDIEFLYKYFEISKESVCFGHDRNYEPLLAIYHVNDFPNLWKLLAKGNESLRKFQELIKPHVLIPLSDSVLMSVDTPEDMLEAKKYHE
jgi:molybdopterin-guanine dinucleotide biosynthesis protein A